MQPMVAVELDVVQVVARGLQLGRILFVRVAQLFDVLVPVERVVVEVHLGVQGHDVARAGHDQRIDLHQAGVEIDEGVVQSGDEAFTGAAPTCLPSRPRPKASRRAMYGIMPVAGSTLIIRIFSGVLAATSSISMPPSVDAIRVTDLVARSTTAPR